MLPYDTAAFLLSVESFLKQLQALIDHPTAMLTPDVKAANALFHKILPLLPFEPSIAARLHQSLMDYLLQSL